MADAGYPSYLEPLNEEQRRAVLHTGKPLLILAGAGSGKTRVITTKIAWLIREKGMDPRSILAVTFTNKAAKEMAERARQIDERAGDAMLRTFHSFGAWFLRRNGKFANLDSSFVIYDDDDVISLLSGIMENAPKPEVKQCAHNISRAKDYFLSPDDPLLAKIDSRKNFRDIYARYEKRMAQIGNVDFGDLIKKPTEILRTQTEVARRFRERFQVIMVDEYQDANVAQFHLLKELCGTETYVCVVGDDDQSIYRFRGAEVKNILEFPDRFNGADIIRLEQNYRSTTPILKTASSVVDCNHGRLGKTLRAEKGNGPLPELTFLPDQNDEAVFCADKIESSVEKKETSWSDWAILYRMNDQSRIFETLFSHRRIPYRIVGSLRFYEREEIKDALALLSFLINPCDEVAFRRVVNKPTRGVGAVTVDKIVEASGEYGGNLAKAGRTLELSQKARTGFDAFFKVIRDGHTLLKKNAVTNNKTEKKITSKKRKHGKKRKRLSACVKHLIIDSGIYEYHKAQDEVAGNSRVRNLRELVYAARLYPQSRRGLLKFLEGIELDRSMVDTAEKSGNSQNSVTLITLHNTKGLEFKRVIMTGLEQGVFPREDKKGEELEEERRLFYVGATRAMDELYFTSCTERFMFWRTTPMQPSLFISEIDKSCLQIYNRAKASTSSYRRSFNTFNLPSVSSANAEVEERAGWKRGQRLFHEDNGYGAVMEVRDSDDGPVVRVRFDSGKETRFLSEYQGRAYEKMGDDY
ncbi:MAG: ATP-dependent helicase [Treponema sp.]|jgi:DNA helicase-2/ATP-dependent DNA helicase PcrA|nr:ATP-dependent helicase [Treponema sp.]